MVTSMPRKLVDMRRTEADKAEDMSVEIETADYPYGLCLCLDDGILEKLDLEDDMEAGDTITFMATAKVTSVSAREVGGSVQKRVELQITNMGFDE